MGSSNTPPNAFSRKTSFLLSTPLGRRSDILELQNSTQKRKLEALQVESASKLQKHALTIEALHRRIDKLESDRKRVSDENGDLKAALLEKDSLHRKHLQEQDERLQEQITRKTDLQTELSALKGQVSTLSLQLEQQQLKQKTAMENASLEVNNLKEHAKNLETLLRERENQIKEVKMMSSPTCGPQEFDPELREILKQAAKNSQVINLKYKRLLKEVQSLRNVPAEKLVLEDTLTKQQIKIDLLESIEKRCHDLETELEWLKNIRATDSSLELKETKETIDTLKEEFEALNDSNSNLLNELSSLEAERTALLKSQNTLLDKIAELENVNRTLEALLQNK